MTAALCWGAGDLMARFSSRAIGPLKTLMLMQLPGFGVLTLYLVASGELARILRVTTPAQWLGCALVMCLAIVGNILIYRAFVVGVISIISPVAASYAAVSVLLSHLSGEQLSAVHVAGIALTLIGVILAATNFHRSPDDSPRQPLMRGVGYALIAAVIHGVVFWQFGVRVTPVLGPTVSVWLSRALVFFAVSLFLLMVRRDSSLPSGRIWAWVVGLGVIDTVGFVAAMIGLGTGEVSTVSVLSSLSTTVTVMLAFVFLREVLIWTQWVGVGLILAGVAMVSA